MKSFDKAIISSSLEESIQTSVLQMNKIEAVKN